jgi:thioredoxin 1
MSENHPKIVDFTNNDIHSQDGLFLLDFWAAWCGPCIQMNPVLLKLVSEETDPKLSNLKIGKINVDADTARSEEFNVRSIPSFFLIKVSGGKHTNLLHIAGAMSYEKLKEEILKHI